jgi:hypothetical protein
MATVTTGKGKSKTSRKKQPRAIRLLARVKGLVAGMFQVTEGAKVDRYFFSEVGSDFGRGFKVEKWDDEARAVVEEYHVNLDGDRSTCECKGHLYHGHKARCRHVAGLLALVAAGKLDDHEAAHATRADLPVPAWPGREVA